MQTPSISTSLMAMLVTGDWHTVQMPASEGVAQDLEHRWDLVKSAHPHPQTFLFKSYGVPLACFLSFKVLRNHRGSQLIDRF